MTTSEARGLLRSRLAWVISLSVAALGVYLFFTHTGHVVSALPYLILLLCPLLHLFGHRHRHKNEREHRHESP